MTELFDDALAKTLDKIKANMQPEEYVQCALAVRHLAEARQIFVETKFPDEEK